MESKLRVPGKEVMLYLLVSLDLSGSVLKRTPGLLDGLEDHLGVGKKRVGVR